jgi:hypothetical protein
MDELTTQREDAFPRPAMPDETAPSATPDRTRRDFLAETARKVGYTAPLVLLFKPRQACASGGSQITQP